MSQIDIITNPIKEDMKAFRPYFKKTMLSNNRLLNSLVSYTLKTKGKQMRPMLVFLCAQVAGKITNSTYTAASLIELLHTATLIHDDIVDESFYRRGLFSVFAIWKAKIAVLLGDYYLAKGLLLCIENNETEILRIVSEAVKEMSEGELVQLEKASRLNITEENYYEIIRKKTATLLSACCASGAYSSGVDPKIVETMKLFGENIGMAFQIKDDLFDYQKTGIIGKPKYNDIQERKMTLPVIYSLKQATNSEKKKVLSIFGKRQKKASDINQIVSFVQHYKGVEYSVNKMNEFKNKAVDLLNCFEDSAAKHSLILLAEYVVNRDK